MLRDLKSVVKSTDAAESYAMGFGLGFRVMGVKAGKGIALHSHPHNITFSWLLIAQSMATYLAICLHMHALIAVNLTANATYYCNTHRDHYNLMAANLYHPLMPSI